MFDSDLFDSPPSELPPTPQTCSLEEFFLASGERTAFDHLRAGFFYSDDDHSLDFVDAIPTCGRRVQAKPSLEDHDLGLTYSLHIIPDGLAFIGQRARREHKPMYPTPVKKPGPRKPQTASRAPQRATPAAKKTKPMVQPPPKQVSRPWPDIGLKPRSNSTAQSQQAATPRPQASATKPHQARPHERELDWTDHFLFWANVVLWPILVLVVLYSLYDWLFI